MTFIEDKAINQTSLGHIKDSDVDDSTNTNSHEETLKIIQELSVQTDGVWLCKRCKHVSPNREKLKYHLEKHYTGLSYECSICLESFRSRVILSNHKTRKHQNIKESISNGAKKRKLDVFPKKINNDISNENYAVEDSAQLIVKEEVIVSDLDLDTSLNSTSVEFIDTNQSLL